MKRNIKELLNRITESGELTLTMKDLRHGVSFKGATLEDIKYSNLPAQKARVVWLRFFDSVRKLKG